MGWEPIATRPRFWVERADISVIVEWFRFDVASNALPIPEDVGIGSRPSRSPPKSVGGTSDSGKLDAQ